MTVERTGLAAGVALDAPTLEAEIITALMQVRNSVTRREGDGYAQKQVAAILRAVAESEMLERHLADSDADFAAMVGDAAAAVAAHLSEVERPTSLLEDDILSRLRAVPTLQALAASYEDVRDAECVRRRGLISAMLDAASNNTFVSDPTDDIVIEPNDQDFRNRLDFSIARQAFRQDCERMDVGLKAADCMVEADRLRNDLPHLPKKRDALIWAMVAIDTGGGHPKHKTQAMRCAIAAELIGLKPSSLGQYLKELRTGKRPQENPDLSEEEHQLFRYRAGRVRKLALPDGGGWDLVLPVVRGSAMVALPKPASKGRADHL